MHRSKQLAARGVIAAVAIVAVAAASFLLFFFFRDNFATHYPIKVLSQRAFRAGLIPWWNFADGGGQPLAGNPNTLTFYPDNLLYLLLPAHVAFNLHFLLHLILGWLAIRALARSRAAAWMYALSGLAVSSTSFYNLVTAVALVPFALWAAERRKVIPLGCAFGLLALAGEPVTILAAGMAVAIVLAAGWRSGGREAIMRRPAALAGAVLLALAIASPQLVAYSEIAKEVERAHGYSAKTTLNASLEPRRLFELVAGPLAPAPTEPHLFLTLFLGVIIVPALWQRSRYVAVAAAMTFFALGRFNPLIAHVIEAIPSMRIARYPEKFAIPLIVALVVLSARLLERRIWRIVTFLPLIAVAVMTLPIDWFAPYRIAPVALPHRLVVTAMPGGQEPDRNEYHARAQRLEPLFGSTAGATYALNRSPDGMHSLLSRIAAERFASTGDARWARIAGAGDAALPPATIVPRVIAADNVNEAVGAIETTSFDEHRAFVAPSRVRGFASPADARITGYRQELQSIAIDVESPAPALLFVNQSYFTAWDARMNGHPLETIPLDLDRLGVLVPAGKVQIDLRFGRHHALVTACWVLSSLLLLTCAAMPLARREAETSSTTVSPLIGQP